MLSSDWRLFLLLLLLTAGFVFFTFSKQRQSNITVQYKCTNTTETTQDAQSNALSSRLQHRETKCTKPRHHIVYIKIQKTGSGTVKLSILEPYGMKKNLTFLEMLPSVHTHGLNYPNFVIPELVYPSVQGNYDMWISESRYKPELVKRLMPKDSFLFFSVRHPVSRFLSAFWFSRVGSKVSEILGITDPVRVIEAFMNHPKELLDMIALQYADNIKPTQLMMVMRNQQLFDLGFEEEDMTSPDLESKIDQVISEFDMVVITERFNESIVLLKRKLCWELQDMVYVKEHAGSKTNPKTNDLPADLVQKILEYNSADMILYEKATKRFTDMIEKEKGLDREVQLFKSMLEKNAKDCERMKVRSAKCPTPIRELFKIRKDYAKKKKEETMRYQMRDIRAKLKSTKQSTEQTENN